MSRFFQKNLTPYVPGEQPADMERYIKLNTNESPYPPSPAALAWAAEHTRSANLYCDPDCRALREKLAELCSLSPEEILPANGSDEILNFAFMAFCGKDRGALFPDVTYGFYPVFAELNNVPYELVPLRGHFKIGAEDYLGRNKTIFIANPNAPTGLCLSVSKIERIAASNPEGVVVVDEAYIDFGGESCLPLVRKYDNLLVTQTFSKSRSMAGARLGFGAGCRALIEDLTTIKYSTNPYNVNSMTQALALGTLMDADYTKRNCAAIIETRDYTAAELKRRGFEVLPSAANFLFARTGAMDGGALYRALREKGVLVRHFDKPRIADFNRITIGTKEQMDALLRAVDEILEGAK